jgi:tetratricopeptide (TPR) repeat protein
MVTAKVFADPSEAQLTEAYKYAYALYGAQRFDQAKEVFQKIAAVTTQPGLSANSLYYYSQCAFRTEDYDGCVKGLDVLTQKWPKSAAITKGFVSRFAIFLINQVSKLQTNWDYYRYKEGLDENHQIIWKESIPPGFKIKRINFKLGFGLYRILKRIQPDAPETAACKQRLNSMINAPITMVWVDEKAPPDKWGHPGNFFSLFSITEKKQFSRFICDRMFYNWKSEKLYQFLDMYDDVRNLKPRFIARTKPPEDTGVAPGSMASAPPLPGSSTPAAAPADPFAVLTLYKLFQVTGYNPYTDSFTSLIESTPASAL